MFPTDNGSMELSSLIEGSLSNRTTLSMSGENCSNELNMVRRCVQFPFKFNPNLYFREKEIHLKEDKEVNKWKLPTSNP